MLYSLWSAVIGVTKWGCPKGLKDGLRHTNISLSKSVNMLLLLMLVAMENQIMKCLLRSGTNQLVGGINIMSPLRFSLHMLKLGRNSTMFELLEKLHQTRWSLHLRVVIFSDSPHPIARISDWFCSLYTTSKEVSLIQIPHITSLHQSQLNCQ